MLNNTNYTLPKLRPTGKREEKKQEEIPCDYTIKIVVIGSVGSGKTSLINRYCYNQFSREYRSTMYANDNTICKELTDDKKVKCIIWDAGFKDDNAGLRYYYLDKCDAVIFVADANSSKSLKELEEEFIPLFENDERVPIKALALTKTDDDYGRNSRFISDKTAQGLVEKHNMMPFISGISALDGDFHNLHELFDTVIENCVAKQIAQQATQKFKDQLIIFLESELKHLPSSSEKHKDFNQIKLKINSKEQSLDELKTYADEARQLAKQHRDKGVVGFFKGTWFREPDSFKIFKHQFDDQNNLKRYP